MSSFGEELRRERELRRITLREVAETTKINLRYLEALENNDFEHLPGGVFNRGFVRAYAQFIGIDPEAMVTAYLAEEQSQGKPGVAKPPPSDSRPAPGLTPVPQPGPRKAWLTWSLLILAVVALGVVGALIYFWLARGNTETQPQRTTARTSATAPPGELDEGTRALAVERRAAPLDAGAAVEGDETTNAGSASGELVAAVEIDRPTAGRLNCDNERIELLDGMPAGTRLTLHCRRFLIVDSADGGALRVGVDEVAPRALGTDGMPLVAHRIDVRPDDGAATGEAR